MGRYSTYSEGCDNDGKHYVKDSNTGSKIYTGNKSGKTIDSSKTIKAVRKLKGVKSNDSSYDRFF
ncbi:MAG: hypothetical protein GQ574_26705 [Crocinitomix sp.]|nr:hypothetical protein [Crocinitomix sp.]